MPRSCGDKGFLWVDPKSGMALGAKVSCGQMASVGTEQEWRSCALILGSQAYSASTVPEPAKRALATWIGDHDLRIATADFVEPQNRQVALDPAQYSLPNRFHPPLSGPSFDCEVATSDIEKSICRDPTLAALDLKLNGLYRTLWAGTSRQPARLELREFEKNWIKSRDPECGNDINKAACLTVQYQMQLEKLGQWMPACAQRAPAAFRCDEH